MPEGRRRAGGPDPVTRRGFVVLMAAGAGLVGSACGASPAGSGSAPAGPTPTSTGPDPDETSLPADLATASATVAAGTTALALGTATGAKEFRYDKPNLTVSAGAKVQLRFSNNTDRADEVGHNWVLVAPGKESEVVASGKAAGDGKDWLNADDPAVLAHSRLIEGGQTQIVRFQAPAAGSYTYLCTFPDHFTGGQKGTLTVT